MIMNEKIILLNNVVVLISKSNNVLIDILLLYIALDIRI